MFEDSYRIYRACDLVLNAKEVFSFLLLLITIIKILDIFNIILLNLHVTLKVVVSWSSPSPEVLSAALQDNNRPSSCKQYDDDHDDDEHGDDDHGNDDHGDHDDDDDDDEHC